MDEDNGANVAVCPNCGAVSDSTADYCQNCGAALHATDQEEEQYLVCPTCRGESPNDAVHCMWCGTQLHSGAPFHQSPEVVITSPPSIASTVLIVLLFGIGILITLFAWSDIGKEEATATTAFQQQVIYLQALFNVFTAFALFVAPACALIARRSS